MLFNKEQIRKILYTALPLPALPQVRIHPLLYDCLEAFYFGSFTLLLAIDIKSGLKDVIENLDSERQPYYAGFDYQVASNLTQPCLILGVLLFIHFGLQRRWFEMGTQLLFSVWLIVVLIARIIFVQQPNTSSMVGVYMELFMVVPNAFLFFRTILRMPTRFWKRRSSSGEDQIAPNNNNDN